MSKLERLVALVREWDRGFYCIRVGTALGADKAQNMATFMPEYEHREWSLEIKGELKPMERPN